MIVRVLLLSVLLLVNACMQPQQQRPVPDATRVPELNPAQAVMSDGYSLPLSIIAPEGKPAALVLALHGFNDYRNAFAEPARYLAQRGILTVAYDQRGFGATAQRGLWAGAPRMTQDAVEMSRLLCMQYPGVPLYVLGESMGGAVVIELLQQATLPDCISGTVLVAPAVWGWQTMPWWQGLALRIGAHLFPGTTLTGEGLKIRPSDNVEMLRALGRDPLVIKATRIDTIYGLTNLMADAYTHPGPWPVPALLLYGAHDEIIPPDAMCPFQAGYLSAGAQTMVLYPQGFHMLTRDLQALTVLRDIAAWITHRGEALPSGNAVSHGAQSLQALCAAYE